MWSRLLVFDAEHILSPSPPCGEVRWGRLIPLERRFALLRESLDPLVRVIADEDATDRLTLESQPQVDRAAVAERCGELGVADRHAGAIAELGGILDSARAACDRVGEQPVDKARLLRLGRLQRSGCGDEVDRFRQPNPPRQALRAAGAWEEAEVHLGQTNLVAAFGSKAEVTCQRQLEAAAEAVTGDGGDEDERRSLHLAERLVREQREHEARAGGARCEDADVSARAEELLGRACDHHVANVAVEARVVDRAREFTEKRMVVAVRGRPVQDYDADPAFPFEFY